MRMKQVMGAVVALAAISSAHGAGFINGGFEDGNLNGWTSGGGCRSSVLNNALSASAFLPGGSLAGVTSGCSGTGVGAVNGGHTQVIGSGYVDPSVGALLGGTVYSGSNAVRVEDTTFGGYASVLTQTVTNYTDTDIFFAWKAVLEGAHGLNDAATMLITLTDKTTNTELIRRTYNAATGGGGVAGSIFSSANGFFYTPQWQIEQLAIGAGRSGNTFELSVLAADCQPTGHEGYVYLDGFGAVIPPPGAPEPGSLALAGLALAGLAVARRRKA